MPHKKAKGGRYTPRGTGARISASQGPLVRPYMPLRQDVLDRIGEPEGAVNGWRCDSCGEIFYAIHVDRGVTPMFMRCRSTEGCVGMAASLMYPDQNSIPAHVVKKINWEWYRPGEKEYRRQTPDMRINHLDLGGLMIRARTPIGKVMTALEKDSDDN